MATYLLRRSRRYYAVLEIPKALRPVLGGHRRFIKALDTASFAAAQRRVGPIIAGWQHEIAEARAKQDGGDDDDPAYWRRWLAKAKTPAERDVALSALDDKAYWIGAAGVEAGQSPYRDPDAIKFYAEATAIPLPDHLEDWIGSARVSAGVSDRRRSDVKRFAETFPTVQAVNRKEVQRWVTALFNDHRLAPATVRRMLSVMRLYWRYLQSAGAASESEEPFNRIAVAKQTAHNGPPKREHFEPSDVVNLLKAANDRRDAQLADMIRLAMYSGARLNEITALKVTDVKDGYFEITASKSDAGVRQVPIHSKLRPSIQRLVDNSCDGYLLSGLTATKYGARGNAIGKRFTRLKLDLGYPSTLVLHSIRKTVATMLEQAGVPEGVAAVLLGHAKKTMSYGLYSGGSSMAMKAAAIEKLTYPD